MQIKLCPWPEFPHHKPAAPRQANCIIEPRCREQFQIAYPTPAYEAVLTEVPDIFVGTPRRLHALVDALAPCVAEAFAAQSTPLPPWRKKLSMLTKWNLKGLAHGTRAPAPVLQPQHAPAFAQSLQLLQVNGLSLIVKYVTIYPKKPVPCPLSCSPPWIFGRESQPHVGWFEFEAGYHAQLSKADMAACLALIKKFFLCGIACCMNPCQS